ncbi:two-component system OmpR family response regulator [Inquilinus ginsengisoli]|uniref:response regulator n=1 Tax=Inquilinus ginsengisoli TaxID=363840 RepID=UPI003D21C5C2
MDTPGLIVVDDEAPLRGMLREHFARLGYRVREAGDGREFRRLLAEDGYAPGSEVALLDVSLPGESGFELARFLREQHSLGIIMLTAAGSLIDRVVGLEGGADDYVTKPFDLEELAARVSAVLRRRAALVSAREADGRFGPYRLDLATYQLLGEDGVPVELLSTELDLVVAFVTHRGRVLSREDLLKLAPGRAEDPYDRSIDGRIMRLRRKLEVDPRGPALIRTVRGVGYIFNG